MSMKVLRAILGDEAVAQLSDEEASHLTRELDDEILRDTELTNRLTKVVREAVGRTKQ
jgi:hypothetical protein